MPDINAQIDRLMGAQAPTQAPTQAAPQGQSPNAKRAHMILMALLPLAAKQGGQTAVTGLLHGYRQAMDRQQADARTGMLDQQRTDALQFNQHMQQGQLDRQNAAEDRMTARDDAAEADRRLGLQQQFLAKVAESMGREDLTPEEASAQLGAFQQMAPRYGLQDGAVQALAPPTSRLERNKLRKILTQVDAAYKDRMAAEDVDKLVPEGGDGQTVGQIRARVSGLGGQPVTNPKPRYTPGSFEDYSTADPARKAQIEKDRKAYQQADDRPRITVNAGAPGSLPPRTQTAVNSIARGWDSLPIVKTVQKQAEAAGFAEKLDPNTKNPADDQALIYAFAKAMDPDSVVREGEYATVQKYAQSWAQSLGFNVARLFTNTTFLTPEARANMKATIRSRYEAGLGQYRNVRTSTAAKINKATGLADGEEYLTDYGGGFPAGPAEASPAPGGVTAGASYADYLRAKGAK